MKSRRTTILLLIILVLGAGLRFYGLDYQPLWTDEIKTWYKASLDISEIVEVVYDGGEGSHPPGYYLFMHYSERLVGESEWALRFPSALAGTLAIPAIFFLGRRIYSEREGLVAALLVAVLWAPIYYSQEARMYSMLLLASILAAYFWILIFRRLRAGERPFAADVLAYGLAASAAAYLHYFGLYLIGLQGIFLGLYFLIRPRAWPWVGLVYGLVLLAYLPWLTQVLERLGRGQGDTRWVDVPEGNAFLAYLEFLFNESAVVAGVAAGLVGVLLLRTLYEAGRGGKLRSLFFSPGFLLALWLVVPFAGVYLISSTSFPLIVYRTLMISLPAAYLLVARSVVRLPLPSAVRGGLVAAAAGLLVFQLVFPMSYYSDIRKEQFREAVAYVVKNDGRYPGSVIVACAWTPNYFDYYFHVSGSGRVVQEVGCSPKDLPGVERLVKEEDARYVWYLGSDNRTRGKNAGASRKFLRALSEELEPVAHREYLKTDVWLFKRP